MSEIESESHQSENEQSVNDEQIIAPESVQQNDGETHQPEALVSSFAIPGQNAKRPFWKRIRVDFMFPHKLRNKLGKFSVPLASVLLLVVIGGGVGLAYTSLSKENEIPAKTYFSEKPIPFMVLSSDPVNEQAGVGLNKPVKIIFSQPVNLSSIEDNFFVTPKTEGEFSFGSDEKEILFKPNIAFNNGAVIKVKLGKDVASQSGELLGADMDIVFYTAADSETVIFDHDLQYASLYSFMPAQDKEFKLYSGEDVDINGKVSIYKSNADALAESFLYAKQTQSTPDGYTYTFDDFVSNTVDTDGLTPITTIQGLASDSKFTFKQEPGVYLFVASNDTRQFGHAWVVVTDKGLLAQQDDSKIIVSGRDLKQGTTINGDLEILALRDEVKSLKSYKLNSDLGEIELPTANEADMIIANLNGQTVVTPLNVLYSLAHVRFSELDTDDMKASLLTDKAAYKVGDTVKLSGFVRVDNDAMYELPTVKTIKLYGVNYHIGQDNRLFEISGSVDKNGRFSAQTVVQANWLPALIDGASSDTHGNSVDVVLDNEGEENDVSVGSFTLQRGSSSTADMSVAFAKQSYLANEKVTATISAKKPDGTPLSDGSVSYSIYSRSYDTDDPYIDDYVGEEVGEARSVKLDGSGNATITIDLKEITADMSQMLTVQASVSDGAGGLVEAGGNTIIYTGNGQIEFGVVKTQYVQGDETITRLYTQQLDGKPLPNKDVQYTFSKYTYDTTTGYPDSQVLHKGVVRSDANGFAEIRQVVSTGTEYDSVELNVYFADSNGSKVQNSTSFYLTNKKPTYFDPHEASTFNLDISGSNGTAKVGDTVTLSVKSPFDTLALVSTARGRIFSHQNLELKNGTVQHTIQIDESMAPSFSVWFTYFHEGKSYFEGIVIEVEDKNRTVATSVQASKAQYPTTESPAITVTTKDAQGNPLVSNLLVSVVDASSYRNASVVPSNTFMYGWNGYRETTVLLAGSDKGIGGGSGGGCGGGHGFGSGALPNREGQSLFFSTTISTDASGNATISLPAKTGKWKVTVQAASGNIGFGSGETIFTVQ